MSWTRLRDLGFDATVATDKAMVVLEENPDVLADMFELFLVLCDEGRSALIAAIAERLPPALPANVRNANALNQYVAFGRTDGQSNAQLALAWTQIAGEMLNQYGDALTAADSAADCRQTLPGGYPFDLFMPYSVNLGIRLTYRQEWRMLGNQRGEIVRTIPLVPKQTEKLSTKIFRRTKVTRSAESLKSLETTTEMSQSSKDSSEIINETAENNGWKAEAEGGLDLGFFKLGGGASTSSAVEETSRETSSHLSESVKKTAGKARAETKVVVSIESESTFERTTASEIQNPNDEIAVTYVYSKLQRQYEVFTGLAELTNVLMVAEPVPRPDQVTDAWIRRYDWIIAKALLDDSYRDTLNALSLEGEPTDTSTLEDTMHGVLTNTITNFGGVARQGVSLALQRVDPTQEAQRGYQEAVRSHAEQDRARDLMTRNRARLKRHIRDNILHYCRAIWSQEDREQRLLRYRRMGVVVPTQFTFAGSLSNVMPDGTTQTASLDGPVDQLLVSIAALEANGESPVLTGTFLPVDGSEVPVADVINPAGPIGYHGNYALYYLRPEYVSQNSFKALQMLKWPYRHDAYQVCGDSALGADEGLLLDPELKRIRAKYYGPDADPASVQAMVQDLGGEQTRRSMTQYVPQLRLAFEVARSEDRRIGVEAGVDGPAVTSFLQNVDYFVPCYADYLYRRQQSRRFPVETNCLVVDILPGEGSALEPFKLGHRGTDLKKADEERHRMELDNDRREALLVAGNLGDPHIDKANVIVVTDEVGGHVNLSILGDETEPGAGGGGNP